MLFQTSLALLDLPVMFYQCLLQYFLKKPVHTKSHKMQNQQIMTIKKYNKNLSNEVWVNKRIKLVGISNDTC